MSAPPKSVVFETPPPSHVFHQTFFPATVKLVDVSKHKVTGHARSLQVTLRYHDTYDVVMDQSLLVVDGSSTAINPTTGLCELRVYLTQLTAAHDGRAFCLEIRSSDGDLESAFSSPIHVVKEKLHIVQQPPDVWFKDEGGREKCMVVSLMLESAPGARIEERVVPLQLRLLYESGTPVLNQSILKLFPDMRPNMSRGRVSISFRIDDVSKNHQGQSFVLEIAPEKQETSQMFQDIAPARTSVIAIRSKRNKRKLNGLTPRNGATPVAGANGLPTGSPLGGVGAPRGPVVGMPMMAHSPTQNGGVVGPPPSQRPRHIGGMVTVGTPMNNQYVLTPHPSGGRMGPMMMAPTPQSTPTQTWSAHIQQPQPATTPMAPAAPTSMTVEWKLAGFEIHPDGSPNVSRPIYRCTHCRRLVDVEMMNHGQDLHAPQCMFVRSYRPQTVPTSSSTPQAQQQQYYAANVTPRAVYPPHRNTTPRAQAAVSTPMNAPEPMAAPTTAHYMSDPSTQGDPLQQSSTGVSPKTLANSLAPSSQRPVLTISPFMNKIVSNDSVGEQQSQQVNSTDDARDGNLFASNAFRNQMDLNDMTAPSPTTEEKFMFLNKPLDAKDDSSQQDQPNFLVDNPQSSLEADDQSLIVSVGSNSLYNEMTSMGINVDGIFSKSPGSNALEPGHPMSDFNDLSGGLTEEDQVFYILARMYSNPQSGKLGLPAFDQFQRMLGFYTESQDEMQTQVVFHSLHEVGLPQSEQLEITSQFQGELQQNSEAVHSLPKYQHNLVLLREDALMYYWSQSLQSLT